MPIRVLSIAHPAVSRERGRLRYYPLAVRQDLDLHLVVPARWQEFGRRMIADPPNDPGLNVHVLPIRFPHAGPMSWYLHFYPGLNRLVSELRQRRQMREVGKPGQHYRGRQSERIRYVSWTQIARAGVSALRVRGHGRMAWLRARDRYVGRHSRACQPGPAGWPCSGHIRRSASQLSTIQLETP